jgi:hypothetical protein
MEWYENLINFAKQRLSIVSWFFICSTILLFTPKKYLALINLETLVDALGPIIGMIFVLSGVLLGVNFFVYCKNQFAAYKTRKQRKGLLKKLIELAEIDELESGFKSLQDCISWSNLVAPLLRFNQQYYANFMVSAHQINNVGISNRLASSLVNTMKSQLDMAIEELDHDLGK